jgi:hypothetical protein
MASNNYTVCEGNPFYLSGMYFVQKYPGNRARIMPSLPEIENEGTITSSTELREMIHIADSIQIVNFGNGHRGLFGECLDWAFCALAT